MGRAPEAQIRVSRCHCQGFWQVGQQPSLDPCWTPSTSHLAEVWRPLEGSGTVCGAGGWVSAQSRNPSAPQAWLVPTHSCRHLAAGGAAWWAECMEQSPRDKSLPGTWEAPGGATYSSGSTVGVESEGVSESRVRMSYPERPAECLHLLRPKCLPEVSIQCYPFSSPDTFLFSENGTC